MEESDLISTVTFSLSLFCFSYNIRIIRQTTTPRFRLSVIFEKNP